MSDETNFYKEIIDNLYDGVYFVDRDRVITYWNKGAERITGYTAGQTIGRACRNNLLNHVDENGIQLCMNNCPLAGVMEDGDPREVESFSNNATVIQARRRISEMRQMIHTDELTRIGNRRHIERRVQAAITQFENAQGPAGLLFMDIDNFKKVNDIYGHETGDKVLRMVANTFRHALRATDDIGRWGGEEFVAVLYNIADEKALFKIAEKVRRLVEVSSLDTNNQSLSVTISIGATRLYSNDTPESILRRADGLMYRSKQAGRNRVTIG